MASTPNSFSSGEWVDIGDGIAHEQRALLDAIDKIQHARLENVPTPKIVAVGDQSAGKSSTLYALTAFEFPRDAGACTRFATEIRLRRSNTKQIKYDVLPDARRPFKEQEELRQYFLSVDSSIPFPDVMRLAVEKLTPRAGAGLFASEDIFIVERSGPEEGLLTVVDLPGLIRVPNDKQNMEDLQAIEQLTNKYMKSSRTIILAIVGGNQLWEQQDILKKTKQFDPTGHRTIGVLTKPDLTAKIGQEERYIELINNKDQMNQLKHGWYVLLNPGVKDGNWNAAERQEREDEFFSDPQWATIPRDRRGPKALKEKLSKQLLQHIVHYIPRLRKAVNEKLATCISELEDLGEGKDTTEEMKDDLIDTANDANKIVQLASIGHYIDPPGTQFFVGLLGSGKGKAAPPQHLRARIIKANQTFAKSVLEQGQREKQLWGASNGGLKSSNSKHARRDIDDFMSQNRGTEFDGDYQPNLTYKIFQDFSRGWRRLADEHVSEVRGICNDFLAEVVEAFYPKFIQGRLRTHYVDTEITALVEDALKEVKRLEKDRQYEVHSYDPSYLVRLDEWRAERIKQCKVDENGTPTTMAYTEAEELLQKALIHYDLMATMFINNVISQIVERHLVQGMITLFKASKFSRMSDKQIEDIALEDSKTRERRLVLKRRKLDIEDSLRAMSNVRLLMSKELRHELAAAEEENDSEASEEEDDHKIGTNEQSHQRQGSGNIPL